MFTLEKNGLRENFVECSHSSRIHWSKQKATVLICSRFENQKTSIKMTDEKSKGDRTPKYVLLCFR